MRALPLTPHAILHVSAGNVSGEDWPNVVLVQLLIGIFEVIRAACSFLPHVPDLDGSNTAVEDDGEEDIHMSPARKRTRDDSEAGSKIRVPVSLRACLVRTVTGEVFL